MDFDPNAPWTDDELDMLGLRSATEGGVLFCGVSEQAFAINGVTYQWPRGMNLTWRLDFSRLGPLSDMDCKDAIAQALKEISDCCDVTHGMAQAGQIPNLRIISQRLDGNSGVLADCEIPVGNVSPSTSLRMRFDDSERWGLSAAPQGIIDFYRVFLHEALHWHGLGHKPATIAAPALIAPTYDPRIRSLQDADEKELVRRYGEEKGVPKPKPTSKSVLVTLEQDGKKWQGEVFRV